jgi:hypothetical protein
MDESSERIHLTTFGAIGVFALAAAFTGLFIGLAVVGLAWAGGAAKVWLWGVVSWTLCQAAAWLWLVSRWASLIIPLERLIGVDLNQDGVIGDDHPDPPLVRIILDTPGANGNRHTIIANIPCAQEKLVALAAGIMAGAPVSEERWCGAGAPFSKAEFRAVREELIKRGLLAWRNPMSTAQGIIVTTGGMKAFRYFASLSSSALPLSENVGGRAI